MPHRYLEELTTESVQAARQRYGSRAAVERMTVGWDTDALLGPDEAAFIAARDGFYLATVGQTGWPYIQYRGGPVGFLHVLDPTGDRSVLAWADLRGNRQYLSVGNLGASPKVSLFLIDYPNRQRLKVLGAAHVLDLDGPDGAGAGAAALAKRLTVPGQQGRVERVITVEVHSYDWNCPQHIVPRWTRTELEPALAGLRAELTDLRAENDQLRRQLRPPTPPPTMAADD